MKKGDRVRVTAPHSPHWSAVGRLHGSEGTVVEARSGRMKDHQGNKDILARVQLDRHSKVTILGHRHLEVI